MIHSLESIWLLFVIGIECHFFQGWRKFWKQKISRNPTFHHIIVSSSFFFGNYVTYLEKVKKGLYCKVKKTWQSHKIRSVLIGTCTMYRWCLFQMCILIYPSFLSPFKILIVSSLPGEENPSKLPFRRFFFQSGGLRYKPVNMYSVNCSLCNPCVYLALVVWCEMDWKRQWTYPFSFEYT